MAAQESCELILGTRDSVLAMWQAKHVKALIEAQNPKLKIEIRGMKAMGDRILDIPLSKFSDKGVFSKELDKALICGEIDFAVHCVKDLTTVLPPGLTMAAILKRGTTEDCILMRSDHHAKGMTLSSLPKGAIVGTSSVRRCSILAQRYPFIKTRNIRGNLQTRYRKLENDGYDAIMLARIGVERLDWHDRISEKLSQFHFPYAVGQGALGIVCREDSPEIKKILSQFTDKRSWLECEVERALLRELEGGCKLPLGINTQWMGKDDFIIYGIVLSTDGLQTVNAQVQAKIKTDEAARKLGVKLARTLLKAGADRILRQIRAEAEANG